uniref:Uncharacterized protein n=1 Tax=Anguilla anguilla TaxID=7936 RepID=A0A0E9W6Z5_ANGAN
MTGHSCSTCLSHYIYASLSFIMTIIIHPYTIVLSLIGGVCKILSM